MKIIFALTLLANLGCGIWNASNGQAFGAAFNLVVAGYMLAVAFRWQDSQ